MGGSSSSSSSQTKKTDNSQRTYIDDQRAAATDDATVFSGDLSRVTIENVAPDVAAELRKAGEAGFKLSESVLREGFKFASEANNAVGSLSNTLAGITREATDEDAKEFLTGFTRAVLLAGTAVAGLWFFSRR